MDDEFKEAIRILRCAVLLQLTGLVETSDGDMITVAEAGLSYDMTPKAKEPENPKNPGEIDISKELQMLGISEIKRPEDVVLRGNLDTGFRLEKRLTVLKGGKK